MPDAAQQLALQEKLAVVRATFLRHLPARLEAIRSMLASLPSEPQRSLAELHRLLHTLSGSAGTFGLAELAIRAHEHEQAIAQMLANQTGTPAACQLLACELNQFVAWQLGQASLPEAPPGRAPPLPSTDQSVLQRVLILSADLQHAQQLNQQLDYLGYALSVVSTTEQLAAAFAEIANQAPLAVIVDETCAQAGGALQQLQEQSPSAFPVICVSTSHQFESRLAAVRAGAVAYFTKPIDVLALAERLDVLSARTEFVPYRVLIVDDDPHGSAYYKAILESAGMEVALQQEPTQILASLASFHPELVLMDIYMPGCSGIELAKIVRQDNKYLDMPIVFLSGEDDPDKQLDAIVSGADEFLVKPIRPEHLVSSVTNRGKRYRALRSLITRDGLTLLLNHAAIKDHVERELERARRNGTELALAMLDLDFFKRVNDLHGHPAGDQVIRALARLLQHRLRRSDMAGRYGGEEFAVIFPGTSAATAADVLDKIRKLFSKIAHVGKGEFCASFSAGVVGLSTQADVEALFADADAALYQAKQQGRNRITMG